MRDGPQGRLRRWVRCFRTDSLTCVALPGRSNELLDECDVVQQGLLATLPGSAAGLRDGCAGPNVLRSPVKTAANNRPQSEIRDFFYEAFGNRNYRYIPKNSCLLTSTLRLRPIVSTRKGERESATL